MIGYFLQRYGPGKNGDIFNQDNNHYDFFQEKKLVYPNYWTDLQLLLIQYHLSTSNNIWNFEWLKDVKKLWNYSPKGKSISVIIPVVLEDFLKLSPRERKEKFAKDAIYAVTLVRERLEKKKLDINFTRLISDLEECNEEYLKDGE